MNGSHNSQVKVTLRIPGDWSDPAELIERLPPGVKLTAEKLILSDGIEFDFSPLPPDDQFPGIFANSCRQTPSPRERSILDLYTVNVGLSGMGGSLLNAEGMMRAAVAIIEAGGAGVFIDNSGLAHGGEHWTEIAENSSPEALSFAFVNLYGNEEYVWTTGMHVLGFADLKMHRKDLGDNEDLLIDMIRYVAHSIKPIHSGHTILDENGPRFQAVAATPERREFASPMDNPFGCLRLVPPGDIAAEN